MSVKVLKDDYTAEEAVELIRMTPANPAQIRSASANLAEALQRAPSDPMFDLESWQCQWSEVEAESKSLACGNDLAEGR